MEHVYMHMEDTIHRYLQSCVGTWVRLGYATFDAQLRKVYFVTTTLYAICNVCAG